MIHSIWIILICNRIWELQYLVGRIEMMYTNVFFTGQTTDWRLWFYVFFFMCVRNFEFLRIFPYTRDFFMSLPLYWRLWVLQTIHLYWGLWVFTTFLLYRRLWIFTNLSHAPETLSLDKNNPLGIFICARDFELCNLLRAL